MKGNRIVDSCAYALFGKSIAQKVALVHLYCVLMIYMLYHRGINCEWCGYPFNFTKMCLVGPGSIHLVSIPFVQMVKLPYQH